MASTVVSTVVSTVISTVVLVHLGREVEAVRGVRVQRCICMCVYDVC